MSTSSRPPARRPLVAGNWKMHRTHLQAIHLVQELAFRLSADELEAVEVVVIPPATALRSVQTLIGADSLDVGHGAQDLSPHTEGAHTGDVSGGMLAALGCTYVVVGHSERRADHGEDDALVAAKAGAALASGLTPIVCVGEPLEVREAGGHVAHCVAQLDGSLAGLSAEQVGTCVVAYEPVWAIGTGRTASVGDAQEMCAALRARLAELYGAGVSDAVRVLYGGSVKSSNASELFGAADVDGGLVGGAALDAEEFAAVCRAAA